MKRLKRNLLKIVISGGLATIPVASHAQVSHKTVAPADKTISIGGMYALDTPSNIKNYGALIQYGVMEEVFSYWGNFCCMTSIGVQGAVSNTHIENRNVQSYGIGLKLKFGAGWNRLVLTASKKCMVEIDSDKSWAFMNNYGAGVMLRMGNYTHLYSDFIFSKSQYESMSPRIKSIEFGIIRILSR